jgi:hypothetical protein
VIRLTIALGSTLLCLTAVGQETIGKVQLEDATVAGPLEVSGGTATVRGGASIVAKDHTAKLDLARGGTVKVCRTSSLRVTSGKSATGTEPLMLALNRGAIEVQMTAAPSDVVMTPDLRFSIRSAGPLDLRLRVTPNGDTCVENRGAKAPILGIADQFGQASYELRPDQHVLFEHGSLREVVDHETSPCGCPPEPVVSVANAGVTSSTPATPGSVVSPKAAEEQHPFPAAVSAGLAPGAQVPQAPPGTVHAQVTTAMSYDAGAGSGGASEPKATIPSASGSVPSAATETPQTVSTAESSTEAPAIEKAQAPPPPPPPSGGNLFRSIGHFFKHLFGGS